QATRPVGSSRSTASRTPSEIWSAILSKWPSMTDSEVKRYSLSFIETEKTSGFQAFGPRPSAGRSATFRTAAATLGEVDDHRHALQPVALAQTVLDVVSVVASQALAGVDLDREPRRPDADLRHVEHLQPVALLGRRLPGGGHVGQEAI